MSDPASRYSADLSLANINNSHTLAIGRVPARSRVLDLGVADGSVARVLRRMGCTAWGVEIDPVAADAARSVCEGVVIGDLNHLDLASHFKGRVFDVVLMLDILEHLVDPATVLRGVGAVLAEGGWGVISLPNVTHASVRLELLAGHFTYTDLGLLDRTHVRFFDRAGVDDLLGQAGWGMFDMARVLAPTGTTEIDVAGADPQLVRDLEADVEALTYQFVVGAAPLGSPVLEQPPVLPAAMAQAAYLEIWQESRMARGDGASGLASDLRELAALRHASMERRTQLRELLGDVEAEIAGLKATLDR